MIVNVLRGLKIHFPTRERDYKRKREFFRGDDEHGFSFREFLEDVTDETSI